MTDGQSVPVSDYDELKRINDQLQQQLTTERMMRKKMALQLERDTASKISGMYMYM